MNRQEVLFKSDRRCTGFRKSGQIKVRTRSDNPEPTELLPAISEKKGGTE
jgi:hypothetical protein